jgi:two-component system sensor kinase FixL
MNLITNAFYAVQAARAENRLIKINESVDAGNVIVSVRDYGSGIDEELKSKLFKPFVTSKEEGIGIGLSISSSIIIDHNGKIWAENKQDGGAEFFFSLNLHDNGPSAK